MKLVKVKEMKMRSRFSIKKVSPFTRSLPGASTKNERNEVYAYAYIDHIHQFTSEYFEISL